MSRLFIGLLLILTFQARAQQNCGCESELNFVTQYYEKNLPGFADNVNASNKQAYEAFKADLKSASKTVSTKTDCFKLLTYYVEFFKDNHSGINMRFDNVNEDDDEALSKFLNSEIYTNRETYELTKSDLQQYPTNDLRGIYRISSGSYTIAIIPSKTPFRDYIGVIIESTSKLWKKGDIKMELKHNQTGLLEAMVYLRNHSIRHYPKFTFENGILGDNWIKTSNENNTNHAINNSRSLQFEQINDSTTYLRIPTFSGGQSARIDSLYKAVDEIIRANPYLIIDVRNNGGGSDRNATHLLNYIYTKPIKTDKVGLYTTPDNIKVWNDWYEAAKNDPENYGPETIKWFEKELKKMKKGKPGTFVSRSKGGKITRKIQGPTPKKVAVMFNRYCASSCETLLFWAKQSDKTIMVGENSGGYVGYGEVGSIQTPCYGFTLRCTMTRYENQRKYEVVGIAPQHKLPNNQDWIEQTLTLLSKKD